MSERRLLALLALLIGLLAALLLLLGLRLPRSSEPFMDWLGKIAIDGILGLIAIGGSLLIYGGQHRAGGIINIVMGIVVLLIASTTAGLLLIFSGILGLVAAGTFQQYRPR